MCSIYGAVGHEVDTVFLAALRDAAKDRGRDGWGEEAYTLEDGAVAHLGNWRATPTPELVKGRLQPYDGVVHNGTIANDKELGGLDGEIDSEVLPRILDRRNAASLVDSLLRVKGSYALACVNQRTVLLGCNYKPLYYWSPDEKNWYFSSMSRHFRYVCPRGQAPTQLPPYSVLDLRNGCSAEVPRECRKRAVVVASSGLDSTVTAAILMEHGYEVCLLHFQYGCKATNSEYTAVQKIAETMRCGFMMMGAPYSIMTKTSPLLTGEKEIAGGVAGAEYAHEWVPARNLVFLSLAIAFAESDGYGVVALGNNLEEAGAYPDNEEQMTYLMDKVSDYAVGPGKRVKVLSPVGRLMKHEIVRRGIELGAPLHLTWSCYRGGERHCGRCGPCFMRREAFRRCGAVDPVFVEASSVQT
jgi:7-cyano-7-deazaguanine synthase